MLRGFRGEERTRAELDLNPPPHINLNLSAGSQKQFTAAESVAKKFCISRALRLGCFLYIWIWIFVCMRYARREANNKYAAKVKMRFIFSATPSMSLLGHTHRIRRRALEVCINHSATGRGRVFNLGGEGGAHLMFISSLNCAVQASRIPSLLPICSVTFKNILIF